MKNFNEIFRKVVTFYNIKSHKKTGIHPLFRRYIFRKITTVLGLKGDVSKFRERYFSEHTMHVLDFSTELQNAEVPVTLLNVIPPPTLKFLEQANTTLAVESVFGIVIAEWIEHSNF